MTEIINNHSEQAINRLLWEFRNRKTTTPAVIDIYSQQIQDLENTLFSLIDGRTLTVADKRAVLDLLGALSNLNYKRPLSGPAKFNNNAYRAILFSEVFKNISYSTIQDVFNILKALGATEIIAFDIQPATLQLNYTGVNILPVSIVNDIIEKGTAPVSLLISSYTSNYFGFAGDVSSEGFGIGEIGGSA